MIKYLVVLEFDPVYVKNCFGVMVENKNHYLPNQGNGLVRPTIFFKVRAHRQTQSSTMTKRKWIIEDSRTCSFHVKSHSLNSWWEWVQRLNWQKKNFILVMDVDLSILYSSWSVFFVSFLFFPLLLHLAS